jgi:hypothetical protein
MTLRGFKTSVEEVTHDKILTDEKLLLMDEQKKWFLERNLLLVKML